jgi:dCMP deaminase
MERILDDFFRDSYSFYFKNFSEASHLEQLNHMLLDHDPVMVSETVNIVKTGITTGLPYSEIYEKVIDEIRGAFPIDEDIEEFILAVTVRVLIAQNSKVIYDLLAEPRDIYREIAAKNLRIRRDKVTDEMIEGVKAAAKKFEAVSYSVEDEPASSWDEYYYNVCREVARNSKCLSRKIGAILVNDKSIISTGYNGPPRGIPRCDIRWEIDREFINKYSPSIAEDVNLKNICPRYAIGFKSGEGLEICPAGHAERNALINAARNGIKTKGTILYMSCGVPCGPCMVEIINAGVEEIVVTSLDIYDQTALYLLKHGKLKIRLFDFIK